ncbi:ribitol/Xylitol/Arabitol transporter [Klebsiella variicola]|uniref:Ribitol/Xylitol/Arabitol transporter n=1 Tax=Klebsiella variicola TaxID=244366 RepID=A0A7H4MNT3_KLEVA|nr:ribitol/Xylitol/Arabitol transporter [Klebsiella variicola]
MPWLPCAIFKRRSICRISPLARNFPSWGRAATLLYTNRNILLSSMVRIINTLSLFGFAVIMPMMFVDELGFTTSEWLQVWAVFFFTTIFSNVLWGILGEKLGWMKVVRWFGCIGMALLQPGVLLHPSALWP